MSSPAKGPYRSRLFNFVNRQSQRFVDQVKRTMRHLKVAGVWGGQILLYPVYLLVQASLSAWRQISSSVKAGLPQLRTFSHTQPEETPPEADTAIKRVLQELNLSKFTLDAGLDNLKPSNGQPVSLNNGQPILLERQRLTSLNNQEPVSQYNGKGVSRGEWATRNQTPVQGWTNGYILIHGVACVLDKRCLVLVTVENHILDILTPQQQHKLASRISWEVADLLRKWRLAHSLDGKKASPSLASLDHPHIFPPIRLFWRLMAWVQTSPVAIAINLFGESRIIPAVSHRPSATSNHRQPKPKPFKLSPSSQIQDLLIVLDNKFLELESHQLVQRAEVVVKVSKQIPLTLRQSSNQLIQALQKSLIKGDSSEEVRAGSQTNRFKLLSLIYAAVDYFFGRQPSNFSLIGSSEQSQIHSSSGEDLRKGIWDDFYPHANQVSGDNYLPLSPSLKPSTSTPSWSKSDELDPWLTDNDFLWGNLNGYDHSQNFSSSTSNAGNQAKFPVANRKSRHQLPEGFNSKIPVKSEKSIWILFKQYLNLLKAPVKLIIARTKSSNAKARPSISQNRNSRTDKSPDLSHIQGNLGKTTPKQSKHQRLASFKSGSTQVNGSKGEENAAIANYRNDSDVEPNHDWIDTKATPEGYIKHPLERVLEWLDITILWIEELVVKSWRLVQRLWPF